MNRYAPPLEDESGRIDEERGIIGHHEQHRS
jgi:hypothetical protein